MYVKDKPGSWVVTLPQLGGKGVLAGRLILTAAHCIEFNEAMSLEASFVQIQTDDAKFLGTPIFFDAVNDIAVIGPPDDQECAADWERFEAFCCKTNGVKLWRGTAKSGYTIAVHVRTREGEWVSGTAEINDPWNPRLWVRTENQIEGGASGGPIVNSDGELVALASHFSEINGPVECRGLQPRPFRALPQWILRQLN